MSWVVGVGGFDCGQNNVLSNNWFFFHEFCNNFNFYPRHLPTLTTHTHCPRILPIIFFSTGPWSQGSENLTGIRTYMPDFLREKTSLFILSVFITDCQNDYLQVILMAQLAKRYPATVHRYEFPTVIFYTFQSLFPYQWSVSSELWVVPVPCQFVDLPPKFAVCRH